MPQTDAFDKSRRAAFCGILGLIDRRISDTRPGVLIASINTLDPAGNNASRMEAFGLIRQGVTHLHQGAPDGKSGALHAALSFASIRRSSLAASLGVKAPQFQKILIEANYSTGHEAALIHTTVLLSAAEADIPASRQHIREKITRGELFAVDGMDASDLRRQMVFDLDLLCENYARACADIRDDMSKASLATD